MVSKYIEIWPYQAEKFHDAIIEELMRLEDYGIDPENGRVQRLEDQREELEKHLEKPNNKILEVIAVEERPIADAIMHQMYHNCRLLVEDGPYAMGELGELAQIYQAIFNEGSNQSENPKNEQPWGR